MGKAVGNRSLPLMRKTFIEAMKSSDGEWARGKSLPLMRKTFIEALSGRRLVRLSGQVSSAYAEDFH